MHPHTTDEAYSIRVEHYGVYTRLYVGDTPQALTYFVGGDTNPGESLGLLGYDPLLSATITADLEQPVVHADLRLQLGLKEKSLSPFMTAGMLVGGRPLFDPGRYLTLQVKCVALEPVFMPSVAPTFQGAGTIVANTAAVTVPWPLHQQNDVALLLVESANETISLAVAAGFVEVTNSPQGIGTAAGAAATRLAVYWRRADSSAMANPQVAASGDHVVAQILTFRGCIETGNPFSTSAGSVAAASTAVGFPQITTSSNPSLIVFIGSAATDTTTPQFSGWTAGGGSPTGVITEVTDAFRIAGNGGGFGVGVGVQPSGGIVSGSATLATSSVQAKLTLALQPPAPHYVTVNKSGIPWRPIFTGRIDSADPAGGSDELQVACRDVFADVLDTWLVTQPGQDQFDMPTANIDDTLRELLRLGGLNGVTGLEFAVAGAPVMLVPEYNQQPMSTLLAMREAAIQNGWDLRGRFGTPPYGPDQYVLTYYEPDRKLQNLLHAILPERYYSLRALNKSRDEVRNVVRVTPSDPPREPYEISDATSIAKYGRRWMGISEDATSHIATYEQAQVLGDSILSDTKEPKVGAEIERPLHPFVEINDTLYLFPNNVHHDGLLYPSVTGYTHTLEKGGGTTVLRTRFAPSAPTSQWRTTAPKMEYVSTLPPSGSAEEGAVWTQVEADVPPPPPAPPPATAPTPTYQSQGNNGFSATNQIAGWPAHLTGDIGLLFVETANETATLTTPNGFVLLGSIGVGTAGAAGSVKVTVFWCRATSSAMSNPLVAAAGNHVFTKILTFRGCIASADPFDAGFSSDTGASATGVTIPSTTTLGPNRLAVGIVANAIDTATNGQVGTWAGTGALAGGVTERADGNTNVGVGGGVAVATGEVATAGASGTMTAVLLAASQQARMMIALKAA